ncbi:MAG: Gfo/Idh/MocA family protein [Verrucomicrobiia bacterium]
MKCILSRRQFLRRTTVAGLAPFLASGFAARGASPNEKLNIGVIGVANQGNYDLTNVAHENIVALCDIDDNHLRGASEKFPQAKTYNDFRRMLDQKGIDAVVVATPDHCHAVAAVGAIRSGRHVYCEKPLARTISETRIITETARKENRVTQLGTQIHAGNNYRRVVELVQRGAVGPVEEVHVWVNSSYGGMELPKETPPVPAHIHYDLWLGPVEPRPYSPEWVPFKWRNWWAFGGGSLADFGCHFMDLPFWALDLKHALSAEVVDGPPVHPESTPPWLIVRYEFPARGEQPPVRLTWYHGGKKPALLSEIVSPDYIGRWQSAVLFVGEKGMLLSDYNRHQLLPEEKFVGFTKPTPFIPDSIGHHKEWTEACKSGGKTTCNFDYSGPLTETALLGNVAYRVGKKLEWNPAQLRAPNSAEAAQYIQHKYRAGWSI